jgi:hypothetical protein
MSWLIVGILGLHLALCGLAPGINNVCRQTGRAKRNRANRFGCGRTPFVPEDRTTKRGLAPVGSDIRLSEAAFELFWIEALGRALTRIRKAHRLPESGRFVLASPRSVKQRKARKIRRIERSAEWASERESGLAKTLSQRVLPPRTSAPDFHWAGNRREGPAPTLHVMRASALTSRWAS